MLVGPWLPACNTDTKRVQRLSSGLVSNGSGGERYIHSEVSKFDALDGLSRAGAEGMALGGQRCGILPRLNGIEDLVLEVESKGKEELAWSGTG